MSKLSEVAYQIDPALWVRTVLGVEPAPWQEDFLRAPKGASIIALTARQVGKTTTASWAMAHHAFFGPNSLSVVACPAQRQSAEAVRRTRESLIKAGAKLKSDNVYGLELENGARVLALPGSDDSIRGLTVDGWIIIDEAARIPEELLAAVGPMRARRREAQLAMLSTAWSRTDPFWTMWSNGDPTWLRLKATADSIDIYDQEYLARERRNLGEIIFNREYMGVPGGSAVSPFRWDLFDRATTVHAAPTRGPLFGSRRYNSSDVQSWPLYKPIIAHVVGRSRDRSTAVVGGTAPYNHQLGIVAAHELPQNLFGSERANALAAIDQKYNQNSLIVADLSNDATYAEILVQRFPGRVIGLQISRHGDGIGAQQRPTKYGPLLVYTIGRTILLEELHREFESDLIRLGHSAEIRRGFEQLANLEVEYREGGTIYQCAVGQHDDLGISFAMLCWAAQHPHLSQWMRNIEASHRPRRQSPKFSSAAWT